MAGDKLVNIEAMKMPSSISAQADGTVKDILAKKGVQVDSDDLLVVMELKAGAPPRRVPQLCGNSFLMNLMGVSHPSGNSLNENFN